MACCSSFGNVIVGWASVLLEALVVWTGILFLGPFADSAINEGFIYDMQGIWI